jgi:L-cysteine S-thiosulfotransferase
MVVREGYSRHRRAQHDINVLEQRQPARPQPSLRRLTWPNGTIATTFSAEEPERLRGPQTGAAGDPARGRAILVNRQLGLCLLRHSGPFPEERLQGSLAPSLAGVGSRYSVGQLRLRIVDASRINPQTIMPPYYRTEGLVRVARAFAGKSILNADQIEDMVAFLSTLKEE